MNGKCGCGKGMRLCPFSLGIGIGVASGIFMIAFAWAAWLWGFGAAMIDQYSAFYYGYAPTFVGGLIGGIWGLVEGFIFGVIVALFYDLVARCCKGKCCAKSGECQCGTSDKSVMGK